MLLVEFMVLGMGPTSSSSGTSPNSSSAEPSAATPPKRYDRSSLSSPSPSPVSVSSTDTYQSMIKEIDVTRKLTMAAAKIIIPQFGTQALGFRR
jgi:hypothetical protein